MTLEKTYQKQQVTIQTTFHILRDQKSWDVSQFHSSLISSVMLRKKGNFLRIFFVGWKLHKALMQFGLVCEHLWVKKEKHLNTAVRSPVGP